MCRKHSGSILPQNCGFPVENVTPPLDSNPTFKRYESSPGAFRGFCSTCGSALTFNERSSPEIIEINVGAFDEDVICGKKDEDNAWEDKHGRHVPRVGGVGKELVYPKYHLYWENAIPGVTDGFEGRKYLQNRSDGEPFV